MFHTINLRHEIEIAAPTERVYSVIADVTRIGELSPECIRCVWTHGTPGEIAARFVGSNYVRNPETGQEWRWEMESEVIVAEFPSAFGWTVLTESWDRETSVWVFTFEARGLTNTVVRQTFSMKQPPTGLQPILDRMSVDEQNGYMDQRRSRLDHGMRSTLARLKVIAETGNL
jgi:hypothetical protein